MPLKKLCERVGMSRQNFYKSRKIRGRKHVDEQLIKTLVEEERGLQPRIGGLKLHQTLRGALSKVDIKIGRDRFLKCLVIRDFCLIRSRKRPGRQTVTTASMYTQI